MIKKRSTSLLVVFLISAIMTPFVQAELSVNPVQATIFEPEITKHVPPKAPQKAPLGNIVRVGISNNDFSNYNHTSVSLTSESKISIINKFNSVPVIDIPKNSILTVKREGNEFVATYRLANDNKENEVFFTGKITELLIVPENGLTRVVNLKRKDKDAVYRGVFELVPFEEKPETFALVNVLDIETYLRGVVPNEMPVSFGHEALKAQAVAARNYVLKPRIKYYKEYDICDSIACQVYFGANTEHPLANLAIKQTENNVATFDGELILAQYSSTAGGHTENYENCFTSQKDKCIGCPESALPYLKGKPDLKNIPNLSSEDEARKFYTSKPESFDINSPYYRWTYEWTKDELEKVLAQNIKNSAYQSFITSLKPNEEEFGKLQDIQVLQRGVSGKIMILKIVTDKNEFIVQKELVIRRLFKKDGKNLPSANFVFDIIREQIPVATIETKVEATIQPSSTTNEETTSSDIENEEAETNVETQNVVDVEKTVTDDIPQPEAENTAIQKDDASGENEIEVAEEKATTDVEKITKDGDIEKIVIFGGGYGHGVGMSQFGAGRMNTLGYTYDEILQHYYQGISITTPAIQLNYPENVVEVKQTFWAPYKKAFLYIENINAPATIIVDMNGETFEVNFSRNSTQKVYTDISRYIEAGRNTATFSIAEGGNDKQKTNIYIELKEAVNE